jgi:1-acyl-sn-glycerol-3-phosphate acyltransferase
VARREFPPAIRWIVRILRPLVMLATRRDWRGAEHLPAGGFVLAVNHVSHTDPLLLGHFLVDHAIPPRFLAKASLFRVPVLGRLVRAAGQIPVERGSDTAVTALESAVQAVQQGDAVVIYPEGTITRDPELWPMTGRSGAARVSLMTGCPVIPMAQWGPQDILAPYAKRLHLFPRRTIFMRVGPPVDLDDLRAAELNSAVLDEASERILDAITTLLADIREQEPPAVRHDVRAPVQTARIEPAPMDPATRPTAKGEDPGDDLGDVAKGA